MRNLAPNLLYCSLGIGGGRFVLFQPVPEFAETFDLVEIGTCLSQLGFPRPFPQSPWARAQLLPLVLPILHQSI
jgi:hypothetical protein